MPKYLATVVYIEHLLILLLLQSNEMNGENFKSRIIKK